MATLHVVEKKDPVSSHASFDSHSPDVVSTVLCGRSDRCILTNITPLKPIKGIEVMPHTVLRAAVERAELGIRCVDSRNLNIESVVKTAGNTAMLIVKGMIALKEGMLDPSRWSMEPNEAQCIADICYIVRRKVIRVMLRLPGKIPNRDYNVVMNSPSIIPGGDVESETFIPVSVVGTTRPRTLCVASLIAASILATAKRRDGNPVARITETQAEPLQYVIDTVGMAHFNAKTLSSLTWTGVDWPVLRTSTGAQISLPMYYDVVLGVHRTRIDSPEIEAAFEETARSWCRAFGVKFSTDVRFGFSRTYMGATEDTTTTTTTTTNKRVQSVHDEIPPHHRFAGSNDDSGF
jgi:hypothetical protein